MDKHKNFFANKENLAISIIMLVATTMRFYNFADWSLSNDELSALSRLRFESFSELINQGVKLQDFHPAGVQVFLWFWTGLLGNDVWVVRLPFVINGILSVWMTWVVGKKWFGSSSALFAAAFMAFLQYPILYSQLARPYAPGLLFSLLTVWFWTKIVFDKDKPFGAYAGFSIFATLTAYTHHYGFLFLIIVGLSGFVFHRNLQLKKYLLASLAVGILYLPHLEIFMHQFGIGGVGGADGWLGKPGPGWILDYLYYAFNESVFLITFLLTGFVVSILKFKLRFTKFHGLAISFFLAMFLIGYFYSIWRNPILQFSILIFVFPYLLLFLFSFLKPRLNTYGYILLFTFLGFGILQTSIIHRFYQKQHFGEFKRVAEKLAKWNQNLGEGEISNLINVNGPFYIEYYLDKLDAEISFLQYDNNGKEDIFSLTKILDSIASPYFSYAWTKPAPAEIGLMIQEKYPCVLSRTSFDGLSEVCLYARQANDSCLSPPEALFASTLSFDKNAMNGIFDKAIDTSYYYSAPASCLLDSNLVYSPGFKLSASEINNGEFKRVEIEVSAYSPKALVKTAIVISMEHEGEQYFWRGSEINNYVLANKWGKAFLSVDLPRTLSPNDRISAYCWNPGKQEIYIDDFQIRFY